LITNETGAWHGRCSVLQQTGRNPANTRFGAMETKCEVIGWLLEDDATCVLVREGNGAISLQTQPESTFGHDAIQTGRFRRGTPIIDPVTQEIIGYEMERLSSTQAA
jgi:hypothetical protein